MKITYIKPPSDKILLTTSLETRGVNTAILVMTFISFVSKRLKRRAIDCLILSLSKEDNLAPNVYICLEFFCFTYDNIDFHCWLGWKKFVILPFLGTGVLVWDGRFLDFPL